MGVMVGRGTAPVHFDVDQLKRTIEALQKAAREPQRSGGPVEPTEMKDKTKLDFYDALPKNRDDADLPNLPKPAPPPPAPAPAPRPEPQASKPPEPAAPKPEKPAPAKPEKAAPAPAPTATAPAGKGYTVQVSAVRTEEEARRMLERLRQRGYGGYVEPVQTPDRGTLYRVRMGDFPSKEFARSTLERLQKDGFEPQVVPK